MELKNSMKVLVTGGAGYIGSTLCQFLLEKNYEVTVVDIFNFGQNSLCHFNSNKKFNVEKIDVRDLGKMKTLYNSHDIIVPLAALVGAPLCSLKYQEAEEINFTSLKNMTQELSKDQYVIYPTTNSGYGIGEKSKFCTEETKLNPISHYGKTKTRAENYIAEKLENSTRLRLATVFGCSPRMRLDLLVNDFVFRAIKDRFIVLFEGHFKRNYIHVRDVCSAIMYAIDNHSSFKGETFNLGLSNANLSKIELCNKIKDHLPSFEIILSEIGKDLDKRDYIVSNEKIEKTGYLPTHTLDDGIEELKKLFNFLIPEQNMRNI